MLLWLFCFCWTFLDCFDCLDLYLFIILCYLLALTFFRVFLVLFIFLLQLAFFFYLPICFVLRNRHFFIFDCFRDWFQDFFNQLLFFIKLKVLAVFRVFNRFRAGFLVLIELFCWFYWRNRVRFKGFEGRGYFFRRVFFWE